MASKVTAQTVIKKGKSYVGTKEKPANSNNVIFNTHYYGRAVSGSAYPWCAAFLWDIFRMAGASDLFYGGKKCAYCPTLRDYYKKNNQLYSTPKVGDLAFFQFSGSVPNHIGLVVEVVNKTTVKTLEGNTSVGNDSNGGEVMIRTRSTSTIVGYGRPKYATSSTTTSSTTKPAASSTTSKTSTTKNNAYTVTDFVKEVQKAIGCKTVNGKADTATLNKTITISSKKNTKHSVIKPIQRRLNALGYNCGEVDGVAGPKFFSAIKKFQGTWMKNPDGIIDAKQKTWKKLLGMK